MRKSIKIFNTLLGKERRNHMSILIDTEKYLVNPSIYLVFLKLSKIGIEWNIFNMAKAIYLKK